ncbi:MAG: thioredoxin family protein [Fibromonadaceae bacterium]|jgi:thiol:disulfide interchange protein DsbD|nr:thioredoxin family protein [Fibromonadaceae bacterium]
MEPPKTELFYTNEIPKIGDTLRLKVIIPQGWHINANEVPDDFLVPSKLAVSVQGVEFEPAIWPEPIKQHNDLLNMDLLLLQDTFTISLPIKTLQKDSDPYGVKVKFTYQACSNICLPPKTIEISLGEKKNSGLLSNSGTSIGSSGETSFFLYLLLAMLGGLLLNLMPCVLPILSLKIFDLMRNTGEAKQWAFATTAGISFSFFVIATIIVIVRLTGNAIGWGFQFQHPAYIATMALGVMIFALNLLGIFEIWMPGSITQNLEKHSKSSFAHGILLVLLSTPCSAPFLGTAVGFAFAASIPKLFAIFAAVAIGLSLPYIILGIFPQWTKKMPRPGQWMEILKQFLSFPMLLTLVWLVWIFARETRIESSAKLGVFLCIACFFAWLSGLIAKPGKPWPRFAILWLVFIIIYIFSWNFWIHPQTSDLGAAEASDEWVQFSTKKLDSLQSEGLAVWVNGSADWCITCKINEKVFESEAIRKIFDENGIVKMRADYTNSNEEALKFFEFYGRSAVPFDLFITSQGKEILMSEILTEDAVIEALMRNF